MLADRRTRRLVLGAASVFLVSIAPMLIWIIAKGGAGPPTALIVLSMLISWPALITICAAPLYSLRRFRRLRDHVLERRTVLCAECDYDLRGSQWSVRRKQWCAVCPEFGTVYTLARSDYPLLDLARAESTAPVSASPSSLQVSKPQSLS